MQHRATNDRAGIMAQNVPILEIVSRDNVGFVITDAGKDDLVLCPASWLSPLVSEGFGCIRLTFTGLRYEAITGQWGPLGDFYLGPSYLFEVVGTSGKVKIMNHLLYTVEETYDSLQDVSEQAFDAGHLNFKPFCDDIFGDG